MVAFRSVWAVESLVFSVGLGVCDEEMPMVWGSVMVVGEWMREV